MSITCSSLSKFNLCTYIIAIDVHNINFFSEYNYFAYNHAPRPAVAQITQQLYR